MQLVKKKSKSFYRIQSHSKISATGALSHRRTGIGQIRFHTKMNVFQGAKVLKVYLIYFNLVRFRET